jgi:hypothetical protein
MAVNGIPRRDMAGNGGGILRECVGYPREIAAK